VALLNSVYLCCACVWLQQEDAMLCGTSNFLYFWAVAACIPREVFARPGHCTLQVWGSAAGSRFTTATLILMHELSFFICCSEGRGESGGQESGCGISQGKAFACCVPLEDVVRTSSVCLFRAQHCGLTRVAKGCIMSCVPVDMAGAPPLVMMGDQQFWRLHDCQ
jgi:hypothetical protein